MSQKRFLFCCAGLAMIILALEADAKGPMVSAIGNKHNLSAQNTAVTYRAVDDPINNPGGQQVCIFCHTPHNSQPQGPLWNRRDTSQVFARYTSNTLKIKNLAASQYYPAGSSAGQPNGSSRLCLSCHDGVTGLGDVIRSGQLGQIQMLGGNNIPQSDVASFHPSTNKMKVGHHPVSFVYATSFDYKTQNGTMIGLDGTSFTIPKLSSQPQMADKVKLQDTKRDGRGWMQCTTCHDAHQNMGDDVTKYPSTTRKVVPFWVYSGATATAGHDAVCNSCHKVSVTTPAPWPTP
jgi:hypothetical protein